MEPLIAIDLELHSAGKSEILDVSHHYLHLYENHCEYGYRYNATENKDNNDDAMGRHEVNRSGKGCYLKSHISCVEYARMHPSKLFRVMIFVNALPDDVFIHYKHHNKAIALFNIIQNWLILPVEEFKKLCAITVMPT